MKKILLLFAVFFTVSVSSQAQLVSFTLQESYTKDQLDSLLTSSGFSTILSPEYGVDLYKVIYRTPYKSLDSFATASAAIVFPKGTPCPAPLACYSHGTTSDANGVPSKGSTEVNIGLFFAGLGGVATVMPDGLGLGDFDTNVLMHPYINYFHAGHTGIDGLRAARSLADSVGLSLNGEIALTGYSQGGYDAAAINKMIQEDFPNEFNIVGAAPMSGPYDLNRTMFDLMVSPDTYSAPGYLPFLLLGNHSVDSTLQAAFPTPSHIFKKPYDTIFPDLFYEKTNSLFAVCQPCTPVPRDMIIDSVLNAVVNDTNHIVRKYLARNDLLGWAPQNPVKIQYCNGDEQVPYLNGVRADSAWKANGAPNVGSEDFGNKSHTGCVEPALLSTSLFLLGKFSSCSGTSMQELSAFQFKIFPNPASENIVIQQTKGRTEMTLFNQNGQLVMQHILFAESNIIDVSGLSSGFYMLQLKDDEGRLSRQKMIIR